MTADDSIKCRCVNSGLTGQVGIFQNRGICLQAFPSFLPHPLPALLVAPFFPRSSTLVRLVPRSLLLNLTKTFATQAITEVLGSRHYIVKVACNLWKRHIDQLLRNPADVASTHGFLAPDYQSMPLDVSPDMNQPYEIVPDSTIPSTYILPTATLDESILVSTGDSPVPNKQPTVSMHVTDPPVISQPAPLPTISDATNVKDEYPRKNIILLGQPVGRQDT